MNDLDEAVQRDEERVSKRAEDYTKDMIRNLSCGVTRVGRGLFCTGARFFLHGIFSRNFKRKLFWMLLPVLLFLLLFLGSYDCLFEERGSAGMYLMDPAETNPGKEEDGIWKASAYTEQQALLNAWYQYEACDSHRKCYLDSAGKTHMLQFTNREEAGDFTLLGDYYEREDNFYLAPAFLKMCDELLHRDEFYYPEHLVQPVYAAMLPQKGNPLKKYITLLPLADDGSKRAWALKKGEQAYAVEEEEIPDEDTRRKPMKIKGNAGILATSAAFSEGKTKDGRRCYEKGEGKVVGTWDYGLGSILQYEPFLKNSVIDCAFTSFEVHVHDKAEDGKEYCHGKVIDVPISSKDTPASLQAKIHSLEGPAQTVAQAPSLGLLQIFCNREANRAIPMKLEEEDEHFVTGTFRDPALREAFGNSGKSHYPIRIPLITSAACFSGNIRYEYSMEERVRDLRVRTGEGSFSGALSEDCTTLEYTEKEGNCAGKALSCTRRGRVKTTEPSSVPKEIAVPVGLTYLETYADRYRVYVPSDVRTDLDFKKRMHEKQEGPYEGRLDADGDGVLTHLDFIINLGFLTPFGKEHYQAAEGGSYRPGGNPEEKDRYLDIGLSPDAEGDVMLLAKVIASEAGPNKLDQLMVASVVLNRIYDSRFPDTLMGVLTSPGQYDSWTNGRILRMHPSEEMIASARQVLNGEFSVPSNVLFQKAGKEGSVYAVVVNGRGFFTHIYSIPRSDFKVAQTDRFGRPAPPAGVLKRLAAELSLKDCAKGITKEPGEDSLTESGEFPEGLGEGPYYVRNEFSRKGAMETMQRLTNPQRVPGLLSSFGSFLNPGSVEGEIRSLFSRFQAIWKDRGRETECFLFQRPVHHEDEENTVLQAITFLNRDSYSHVAEEVDLKKLQFFFLGKEGAVGMGTAESMQEASFASGVDSTLPGFLSPTENPLPVLASWKETTGAVHLSVSSDTAVLSVGDGRVKEVRRSRKEGYRIYLVCDGPRGRAEVIYDGLSASQVTAGERVKAGEKIGKTGKKGLWFSLLLNGKNVDPMDYFYQGGKTEGAAFFNILNEAGYADPRKQEMLLKAIRNSADSSSYRGGPTEVNTSYRRLDRYHNHFLSRYVGECTWWAYGRGRAYADGKQTGYAMHNGYGNGGDYYDRVQQYGDYAVGRAPRAGSWICWQKPGGYGHVAFVEAVERDGSIWISESYRRAWDRHDGKGILLRKIRGPKYFYGAGYRFRGFVYLDRPL